MIVLFVMGCSIKLIYVDKMKWESGSRMVFRVNKNEKAFCPIGCNDLTEIIKWLQELC